MRQLEQAVIFCGGLGTRLKPLTDSMPKPMVPVHGKPFLEHLLQQLVDQGINRFLLLTGYLGEMIHEYFGDGYRWGWMIEYSHGPKEWETGRRLWEARGQLDDRFLLLYSDNFAQFRLSHLMALHNREQVPLTFLLAPKDKGNIRVSSAGRVEAYIESRVGHNLNYVELGYMIVERDVIMGYLSRLPNSPHFSFSVVLHALASEDCLAGLVVRDLYHSISDPVRLNIMRRYLEPKRILLIDRDGVINQKAPQGEYIANWEAFNWVSDTRLAMQELAQQGFRFIVITNQAGVARGMVSEAELVRIHQSMVADLSKEGIEILGVYACLHHWNEDCPCRKPKPGMFFNVSSEHLIRMDKTIFVGDDIRDCEAAFNAGCGSLLIAPDERYELMANRPKWSMNVSKFSDAVSSIIMCFEDWESKQNIGYKGGKN